ncbi:unnamed protein product [Lactuca virosa]|uniref:RNA polymerase II transcription factor B subunit 2 n=1 Tax=Lactuca virosa TaxID=75947 RepID=A0AAU9P9Q9_9ASTR|nr:unnamed protein product [Lactuca virosa]
MSQFKRIWITHNTNTPVSIMCNSLCNNDCGFCDNDKTELTWLNNYGVGNELGVENSLFQETNWCALEHQLYRQGSQIDPYNQTHLQSYKLIKMPQVKIIAKNFMDMVSSLPAMKLDKLYENAFICEAILRSLPPLAKKYVLQLLYIDVPVSASSLQEWVLVDGASKHRVAVDRLIQLRVFTEPVDRKKEATYRLNLMFQMNLRKHVVHGGVLPREPMAANITVRFPSLEELDNYAAQQWECFLLHLINSAEVEVTTKSISPSMMKVSQRGLLSQRDNEGSRLTESGFHFLLMDTNAQLWYNDRGVDSADLISFLLELSFHVTGETWDSSNSRTALISIILLAVQVQYLIPNQFVRFQIYQAGELYKHKSWLLRALHLIVGGRF